MKTELYYFLISKNTGVPVVSFAFSKRQDLELDPVLVSGFSVAMSQFISEVTNVAESNIQFAQYSYEGIIEKNENGDYIYILLGNSLFKYQPEFYSELFQFIDSTFLRKNLQNIETIKDAINSVFASEENSDIMIPIIIDRVKCNSFIWSNSSRKIIEAIDGEKNLKEIAVSLNISEQIVFVVTKILEWLGLVEIKLGLRNYLIFEKTSKSLLLMREYVEDYNFLNQYFPRSLKILEKTSWTVSIQDIYRIFPEDLPQDLESDIYILLERKLLKTISAEKHLILLLYEYISHLLQNLQSKLNNKKFDEVLPTIFEPSNPISWAYSNGKIDLATLSEIFNVLRKEEKLSIHEIFNFVTPILNSVSLQLSKVKPELPKKVIGETIMNILGKYGFTLERFELLNILCPEEYLT